MPDNNEGIVSTTSMTFAATSSSTPSTPSMPSLAEITQLSTAIERRNLTELKRLIQEIVATYGKSGLDRQNNNGKTPLLLAAQLGCTEAITYLLDHGADVTLQDNEGNMPLHWAIRSTLSPEVILRLIAATHAQGELDRQDKHGRTPFFLAIQWGYTEAIACLRNHGADMTRQDNEGRMPLHAAIQNTLLPETELQHLINATQALGKLDGQDKYGRTPLLLAIQWQRTEAIAYLRAHGANIDVTQKTEERTPAHRPLSLRSPFPLFGGDAYSAYRKYALDDSLPPPSDLVISKAADKVQTLTGSSLFAQIPVQAPAQTSAQTSELYMLLGCDFDL